jgi:glycosyltransferase involved in cell wall biosynthesis
MKKSPDIALFLRYMGGGGADQAMAHLARGFIDQGLNVDFVLGKAGGNHTWKIPAEARVIELGSFGNLASLGALTNYLRKETPRSLLSAMHFNNEIAILAKRFAGVSTRVVVCEQNNLSKRSTHETQFLKRHTPIITRFFYPWADGIVTVSQGVAKDLEQITHLPTDQFHTILNPAITPDLMPKSLEPVDHPWFKADEPPVILGVGKLEPQKDFPTLLRAFAEVRRSHQARLMILGWGPGENGQALELLAQELGIQDDFTLPGYVNNPYAYMAKAAVFVLSSQWEGLPLVLVEAMAVGTPVVATDCESGPAEILKNGQYGTLVPVGNHEALANGINSVLDGQTFVVDQQWLQQYTVEAVAKQYAELLLGKAG